MSERELVVEYTLICKWCGVMVEPTDIERVWAHIGTGTCICAGYRKVDKTGRVSETWATPTLWSAGEDGQGDG